MAEGFEVAGPVASSEPSERPSEPLGPKECGLGFGGEVFQCPPHGCSPIFVLHLNPSLKIQEVREKCL